MANNQAVCNTFKQEVLSGLHALGTCTETRTISTKDALKMALFLATGSLGASTTTYTSVTASEVSGTGYSAGGAAVTNGNAVGLTAPTAFWTPSASVVWSTVTLSSAFDCALLYNDQFTTKRAIAVFTFGSQTVSAGNFTLTMPTNDSVTGLIRLT